MLNNKVPPNWITNEKVSHTLYDWHLAFKKRHPEITVRIPEKLSNSRAEAFNKKRVETFFQDA